MKLIIITALIAVCQTAKLDRTYLPPPSAASAGGNHNSLQTPLIKTSEQVASPSDTPLGSYTNEYQGVVVDAAAPGTRASSENDLSGLGAPRPSYGSTDSKVGDAAFRGSIFQGQGNVGASDLKPERPQASKDRNSNILTYSNDVNPDAYSYGFETDNGIAVGENGVAANGIQAEGGYSYQGDDGQTYKVTYVADDKGYRPQGAHLPTPPPIPDEILKSLQQNAQEEAAGIVDDGSYDAQKYNGEYTHHNSANIAHNGAQLSQFGKRPDSGNSASGSFINQNNQGQRTDRFGSQTTHGHLNQGNQFGLNTQHQGLQGLSGSQGSQSQGVSTGQSNGQFGPQTSQFSSNNHFNEHASQFGVQSQSTSPSGSQYGTPAQLTPQSESQFGSQRPSSQPSGSQFGFQAQSTRPSGSQYGAPAQSLQGSGSQFKPQSPYTQSPGSLGTQFGSQAQSTQTSGSQVGVQGQHNMQPSGSLFGSQVQSTYPSGSQFGTQVQSTRPPGLQFGAQDQHITQLSGSFGSQFGSQVQSTYPSGSQFGIQAQSTRPSGSQFGAQGQHNTQTSGSEFGYQVQSTQPSGSQFGIQGQSIRPSGSQFGAHAQSTHPFRPQFGNQPQFGSQYNIQTKPQPEGLKPIDAAVSSSFSQSTVTPSPISENPFNGHTGNKPFNAGSNQLSTQNQLNKFGASSSSNINRFPQTPNQFGANNEYLPPSNTIGSRPQFGAANTFNNGQNQIRPSQSFNSQTHSPGFQQNFANAVPSKPNNFLSQAPSRPNQFSGNFQSLQNQQFNSNLTPSQSSQSSQTISNLQPTSSPDTGLTTPLEPNEVSTSSQSEYNSQTSTNFGDSKPNFSGAKPNSGSSTSNLGSSKPSFVTSTPDLGGSTSSFESSTSDFSSSSSTSGSTPNFGGSKPSSGSSTSSFNELNKQPSNQFGQSQQFNTQGNLGSNSPTATSPRPQTSNYQYAGQSNNGRPQFQQNYFSQNQFNQKPDDSYYYNQPPKSFNTPQGSRFPSSPSYQPTISQSSQFGSQQNSFTKVPGTPVLSTSTNQFTQNQGSSTNFNGITQAAISPFPSISPTSSTQFGTTQNNQFDSKPSFSQSQSSTNQPSTSLPLRPQFGQKPTESQSQTTQNGLSNPQTDSQNTPTVQNQQYEGTIYEYNKPAETLPSAQSDSDSSQTIQSNIASSKPEDNKPTNSQIKPTQVSQFGQNSFTQSQQPNFNQDVSRPQFGSQSNNTPNQFGQTGSQTSSQQQFSQVTAPSEPSQTNFGQGPVGLAQQPLGTTGSGYLGYPSAQDSKPQFGSNFGEISKFPTVGHSNFKPQNQKPNEQNVGFDYKPQFPQDKFSQDFQSPQMNSAIREPSKTDQSNLGSDSQPFPNMAVPSILPSPPSKPFLPQSSAQAVVSSEPLDFIPLNKPQNQFNQPSSPQPVKSTQPSQYPSYQSSTAQGTSGKGEDFGGPRQPPSFDEKTGYHY